MIRRLAVSTRNGLVQSVPQNILGCGNLLCAVVEAPPPDPAILAQFSFVAVEDGAVGVVWGTAPEFDNAVPPPPGRGALMTMDSGEGLIGVGSVTGLPGATECPLRIEIFQNGEPFVAIDLYRDSKSGEHTSGSFVPVSAMMVAGESYTGLIRQLPCPP